jgi:15-O-acetyltransferase Tri3
MTAKMTQKNNHGVPLLQGQRPETQERHFITLPEGQSTSLVEAVKRVVGCDSNITHLGHAAMVLALLQCNPLTEALSTSPQPLYSPCWLSGRRYLLTSFQHPAPMKDYIPLCLSFAPVIFPDLRELSIPGLAGRRAIKPMLVKACKIATAEYEKIKIRKSMLPECVALFESFADKMRYALYERLRPLPFLAF